jgi:hypothetical protein
MDKAQALLMQEQVVETLILALRLLEHPPLVKDDGPGHYRHEKKDDQDQLHPPRGRSAGSTVEE